MSEPILDLSPSPGDSVKTTTCYMCACRCGIKVWLKDGKLRYIQGNPAHPVNRGVLCAKGAAGIMQHYSPARLKKPLLRVGERGAGEFREIEWDEALSIAAGWLGKIRERNPDELAFFTGRDQSQALTGWWAQQFGTINYAAHGGFCSVNMAAAGLYTLGGSFWEFGEPDWEHTRYLMLWGVAEDHDSNPIKLGLGQLKARGAKIVAINPVRTGYGAIADEWVGIRPGTDGLLAFALIHELLRCDRIDLDYLVRYTNAHWLVIRDPGASDDGLFARDEQCRELCAVRDAEGRPGFAPAQATGIAPLVVGEYTLPDGRLAVPALHLVVERYLDPQYAPAAVAERCGVPADTIRRLAQELAQAAFDSDLRLPIRWADVHGVEHAEMIGRPVAMHAMRGISAHSNGFHTCRALHLLQLLLGAVDTPGSFRYQPPYPRPIPPANRPGKSRRADGSLDAGPLGFIHGPEDLLVDENGQPRRIDHAFSWAYPLAAHGMMHTVIRNAWAGDPYPIDTLFLFMANMSWNSAMNTTQTMHWLTDKHANGEYRIPHIIYSDAYASEMVAYADLVLPDTTYLERFDAISLLDRPISDADGVADAIRHPVLAPETEDGAREVRGFQSVLLELGARLKLPGMVAADGTPSYRDYADYIVRHERAPGVGLLAGWRGDGEQHGKGAPNPDQLKRYIANGGFWRAEVPLAGRYYKMANRDYLQWAQGMGLIAKAEPITLQLYSETLQKFRLAGQGHGPHTPPAEHRERVARYFDPLPLWYEPLEGAQAAANEPREHPEPSSGASRHLATRPGPGAGARAFDVAQADGLQAQHLTPGGEGVRAFPLHAITQRPMFMYHAWGSQNAWLRQIATRNYLYLHPDTAARFGVGDDDWVALRSQHSQIVVPVRLAANVQPDTVWTWNAIGKRRGAWRLHKDAPESKQGFLLNHLIDDLLPDGSYANADPITGQAAWFDLRVSLQRVEAPEAESHPQFAALKFRAAANTPLRYRSGPAKR
ncbi:MAG: molybdopterin oxidoreductase family protein [Xanthomonadaceae bacterium]|nr:molybdopterin oxidoreductase family protein [Xanthomonadaceae bacterium]MDP2184670.1 molybdopterin oxidoreductase family protein [Xanthomonadales bacterium]MDZ4117633.1 molybdopterin oxidoreductase family protein [Xanthomonadaceae bacterium]MDZ4377269.1 molybdopterin oxidoreductase family protein [Xanthomonadaceae bacterium]